MRRLWLMFACGLGESEEGVRAQSLNPETQALIDTFRRLSRQSYAAGLGALYAYESQFPGVASAKIEGLIDRYGIADEETLRFFRVHESADVEHSAVCRVAARPACRKTRKMKRSPRATSLPARCGTSCRASKPGRS